MNPIKTTTLLLFLTLIKLSAQTVVTDLNGFRLGQFREVATNELGKPFQQGKYEDGFQYEVFLLKPDTSMYMVFEYAAGDTNVIWSIQISGYNTTSDIGFKGFKLGIDKKEVLQLLGKPDKKDNIGDYGEKWNYDKTNYSVEISKNGKLSSVKIRDTYSNKPPDVSKLPKFDTVIKLLNSKNNADIAGILAPGIEIYYKDRTLFFEKSLKTEIETDHSKIFKTIREISTGLDKINTSDEKTYEENIRMALGQNPKHVVKIKGHKVKEIVFEYVNGQYLIWEILAK